jgi:hypothetical protein
MSTKPNQPATPKPIKLKSVQFQTTALIDYQVVSSFTGDITLEEHWVIINHKSTKYMVPLSNISTGVLA